MANPADQQDEGSICWVSSLPQEQFEALDQLLFYNPNQESWIDFLDTTIERVGSPQIHTRSDGRIFVALQSPGTVQSLIAVCETQPIGVVVYSRIDTALRVLFMAIDDGWTLPKRGSTALIFQTIARLQWIARRIVGINEVVFFPGCGRQFRLVTRPTRKRADQSCSLDKLTGA